MPHADIADAVLGRIVVLQPSSRAIGMMFNPAAPPPATRANAQPAREVLYNGITLPNPWPPRRHHLSSIPARPPYLASPPDVINIDVGRQLFVDDFLIEESSLHRAVHKTTYHPSNPVLTPEQPWEIADPYAAATRTPPSAAAMVVMSMRGPAGTAVGGSLTLSPRTAAKTGGKRRPLCQ